MTRPLSVLVLSLILLFTWSALPATASAQLDDGVRVDPDSAPAKEYALPLEAARAAASSNARKGSQPGDAASAGGPAAAFGSGITPKPAPTARRSRSGTSTEHSSAGPEHSSAGPDLATREQDRAATVSNQRVPAAGGNPILYSLGGVLAVLVAGGLVALTLRRRQSPA